MQEKPIKFESNVPCKMRDGTLLYADIHRPDTDQKYPAIVARTPYGKTRVFEGMARVDTEKIARAGYAVITQDIRGSGASPGEFRRYSTEMNDSYDTIEWAASQPWCNGNVGMYGISTLGVNQWRAAMTQPPHLKAIFPAMSTSAIRRGWVFLTESGVFRLQPLISWYVMMSANNLGKSNLSDEELKLMRERIKYIQENPEEQFRYLPLKDIPGIQIMKEIGMGEAHPFADYVSHIGDTEYWKETIGPPPLEKVMMPVFHLDGWLDQSNEAFKSYVGMQKRGGTEQARKNQKIVVGPWTHGRFHQSITGDHDFGADSTIDISEMYIRWYDYWLKGIDNGIMDEPPVRIFVMGDNVWRDEYEWPLARTKYTEYYFHSNGRANSRFGDGTLNMEIPENETPDTYCNDPRNPIPTTGAIASLQNRDYGEVERRGDMLIYTSAVLESDIEVTGPVIIKLWAASSAVDTDFTGKLVDVCPDGRILDWVDGIVRARYRESVLEEKLLEPGKIYLYTIDLGTISNVFKAGHRIRVEIASSNFPKWDRNLNTGHPVGMDSEIKTAMQTIYHDGVHPSHILLPIIPR